MTLEEFKERFAISSTQRTDLTPDEDSVIAASRIDLHDKNDRAYLSQLLFVDGRVAHFRITYENYTDQFAWEDVDQFASQMSESLGLPDSWESREFLHLESNRELYRAWDLLGSSARLYDAHWGVGNPEQRFLMCDDVLVGVGVPSPGKRHWTNGAFIQFDDLVALQKVKERREQRRAEQERKEREQREGFNP